MLVFPFPPYPCIAIWMACQAWEYRLIHSCRAGWWPGSAMHVHAQVQLSFVPCLLSAFRLNEDVLWF